ncbi:unnamed protein product, partial [Amoebophrya sp. A25]
HCLLVRQVLKFCEKHGLEKFDAEILPTARTLELRAEYRDGHGQGMTLDRGFLEAKGELFKVRRSEMFDKFELLAKTAHFRDPLSL